MSKHLNRERMITFLLETPLFDKLDPTELMEIIHVVEEVEYREGDLIFKEGDPGDAWYVVYRGGVEVLNNGEKVADIGAMGCFGEMSILDQLPRSATIRAASDSVLLRVGKAPFDELIKEQHLVAYKLIQQMAILLSERQRNSTAVLSELLKDTNVDEVHAGIRGIVGAASVRE